LPLKFRYVTTIAELSLKVPPSFIPHQPSGQEILNDTISYIDELKDDGLLTNDPQFSNNREPQDQGFYITASGRLYIRKHYQGLTTIVENKRQYEQIIESLESDSHSKKYLKGLRKKLLSKKTEDAIISAIISEIIHVALGGSLILLRFLAVLLHQANPSS
jgi:DNA-binding PadR family transcriptional regulator